MKARLAYLTTPAPDVYVLNIQPEGTEGVQRFEISRDHLANIIVDGAALLLRKNRVPETASQQRTHERSRIGAQ